MKSYVKKMLAVLLAVMMLVNLAACSDEDSEETQQNISTNETEDIMDIVESVAQENSDIEVDNYVVSSEGDFTWEETDGGAKITGYLGADTAIEIPETLGGMNVVAIGSGAFSGSAITGIKLSNSVVTVEEKAFYYCTTLVEAYFGNNVKMLGAESFEGCVALSAVKLNDNLQSIGQMAFGMCTSLKEIELPDSLNEIGEGAFGMSGLVEITIPGTVKVIGKQAFTTCSSLETVIIENGVVTIDKKAFEDCASLKRIEIPASVETLEYGVFMYTDGVTIFAPSGSAAEAYAQENGISFENN